MQHRLVRPRPSLVVPPHVAAERRAVTAKKPDAVPPAKDDDFVQTSIGVYTKARWDGRNRSGMRPGGDRLLVMTDMPATTTKSGRIAFTEDQQDKTGLAAETGVLVECGDGAFTWSADRTRPFSGTRPEPGQRIYFERYAGSLYTGRDGKNYRVMDDRCFTAFDVAPDE